MASSKLVTTNPDLPRQSSICSLSSILADLQNNTNTSNNNTNNHNESNAGTDDPSKALGSMSMEDIFKSMYSSSSSDPNNNNPNPAQLAPDPNFHPSAAELSTKTAEEVWQEMVEGDDQRRMDAGEGLEAMTLEDFLAKAGAVREEDVRGVPSVVPSHANFRVDAAPAAAAINGGAQFPMPLPAQVKEGSSMEVFGNGMDRTVVGVSASAGRGKRRVVEEPVDKATLQKQRRMIKNRESAARSRERKQAYTVELETMVTQLEAENAQITREMAEKKKQRYKQLMENLIPVVEKRCRPQRKIRRVNSALW